MLLKSLVGILLCTVLLTSSCIAFTTNAQALEEEGWGTPTLVHDPTTYPGASNSAVAMNDQGDAIVAWLDGDSAVSQVQARFLLDGVWEAATAISSSAVQANDVQVAIDEEGDAVAVWQQRSPSYAIWTCTLIDGTWGIARTISAGTDYVFSPQVIMDSNNDIIVIWMQQGSSVTNIMASVCSDGEWGISHHLSNGLEDALSYHIATKDGKTTAVWSQRQGRLITIDSATYSTGAWSAAETISNPALDCFGCHVSVDGAGNAVAAWAQTNSSGYSVIAAVRTGAAWGAPQTIAVGVTGSSIPRVAIGPGGVAVVAWMTFSGERSVICASVGSSGAWGPVEVISDPSHHAYPCEVTIGDAGEAIVVWGQTGPPDISICANVLDSGGWRGIEMISLPGYDSFDPCIAMAQDGAALVVWNAEGSIYANTYAPLTIPSISINSPTEGSVVNGDSVVLSWRGARAIHYSVSVDGGIMDAGTSNSLSLFDLPDGTHQVTVFAYNSENAMGSDQVNFTVDSTTPVVDNVPPTAIVQPIGDGVEISSTIIVTFSEAMDKGSVMIKVEGFKSVTGTMSWNGNVATFTPSSPLEYNERYNVSVTGKDLADNSMAEMTSGFTTVKNECTISGIIKDKDGNPIVNATVKLDNGMDTTTDVNGRFVFTGVPSGSYSLNVTKDGFQLVSRSVNLIAGEVTELETMSVDRDALSSDDGLALWIIGMIGAAAALGIGLVMYRRNK